MINRAFGWIINSDHFKIMINWWNFLYQKLSHYIFADSFKLLGNPDCIKDEAKSSSTGMALAKFGIPCFRQNIIYFIPKDRENYARNLKLLMDLSSADARSPYSDINNITGSNFFLSSTSDEAQHLHQKLAKYLKPRLFSETISTVVETLFKTLAEKFDTKSETELKPFEIIRRHILKLFTIVLFDFEPSEELVKLLEKLENFIKPTFLLPSVLKNFDRDFTELRAEFNTFAHAFLREQIELAKLKFNHTNLLSVTLLEKTNGKPLKDLNDTDINQLVNDQDVRLCISGLLGVSNLIKAMMYALPMLYNSKYNSHQLAHLTNIQVELAEHNVFDSEDISRSLNKLPYLHAFYLELLRLHPPMPGIVRYTQSGIPELNIPPRSTIIYSLTGNNVHASNLYPSDQFHPERFLEGKQLKNDIGFHQDCFFPFGIGKRQCPATDLSKFLFKYIIASFAEHVSILSLQTIQFRTKVNKTFGVRTNLENKNGKEQEDSSRLNYKLT